MGEKEKSKSRISKFTTLFCNIHSRMVFLAAHDGMLFLVALRAENIEIRDSNFLRLEIIILLQTDVKLIVTLAVQSEIQDRFRSVVT